MVLDLHLKAYVIGQSSTFFAQKGFLLFIFSSDEELFLSGCCLFGKEKKVWMLIVLVLFGVLLHVSQLHVGVVFFEVLVHPIISNGSYVAYFSFFSFLFINVFGLCNFVALYQQVMCLLLCMNFISDIIYLFNVL